MSSRATATSRIPADIECVLIGAWIGGISGLRRVMLAPALGDLFPGGPMVSFPRALAVWEMGAGQATDDRIPRTMVGFRSLPHHLL